ncbi:MAG: YIP1 family protein [Bacteroidetes bacterium]|nr:YIP1 family protein [Bacteroidota bacterium]
MEETTNEILEPTNFSDQDVFTKIWTSPRKIFKYINETNYEKYFYLLLFLAGVSRGFDRASTKNMGDNLPLLTIVGFSIVLGGLLGWISFYLYAALVSWTGNWLKAEGDTKSIFRILTYGMLPSVIGTFLLIPQIAVYGNELFKSEGDITSAGLIPNLVVYSCMFLEFALAIWTIILCVIGISEVQKLSIGKSIINALLPVIVILVPIALIMLLITGIR